MMIEREIKISMNRQCELLCIHRSGMYYKPVPESAENLYIMRLIQREKPIAISMDGKGRCIDNIFIERLWKSVKYDWIYLHAFEDGVKLYEGLQEYFYFYSNERFHQSLVYQTPASQYSNGA